MEGTKMSRRVQSVEERMKDWSLPDKGLDEGLVARTVELALLFHALFHAWALNTLSEFVVISPCFVPNNWCSTDL